MDKWTELTNDQEILDIVSDYQLEFVETPYQQKPLTPFDLSKDEERLVDLEVEKLLTKGATEEMEPCKNQFLSNIFTIPKKGGGRRPVVDTRDLNSFIEAVHFKMEDLLYLPSVLRRGDIMCKRDLQDAYQTIPIAKKSRIYLRFLWKGRLYQFTCLPFWPQILSKNFYKGSEIPLGLPQSSGSSSAGVFSRHTYHGSNPRAMSGAYPADMAVVDRFRFPEEVSVNSQTADRIPWVPREFHRNETVFNRRKTVKIKTRSRVHAEIKPSGKDVGKLFGLLPVNSSSHCSGPSSFQKITGRYEA